MHRSCARDCDSSGRWSVQIQQSAGANSGYTAPEYRRTRETGALMFISLTRLVFFIVILVSASFAASEPTSPPGPPTETSTATETSTTLRSSSGLLLESFAQPRQIEIPSLFNIVFRIHNATPESVELYDFKLLPVDIPWAIDSNCTVQQVVIDRNSFHHIPCAIFTKGFKPWDFASHCAECLAGSSRSLRRINHDGPLLVSFPKGQKIHW